MFRAMLRETRASGCEYALLVHQDNGSGKLVRWYEGMGFKLLPPGNAVGLKDGMLAALPPDIDGPFYMDPIRAAADVYDGRLL